MALTERSSTRRRDAGTYRWLAGLTLAAFALLAARLWQLQVLEGDRYYRRSADNFVKQAELPATRGHVADRKGRVLIENRPRYNVYLTPRFVTDDGLARLARHLQMTDDQREALKARLQEKKGAERLRQVLAFDDVTRDQMGAIESDQAQLPGVAVVAVAHRVYPFGHLASHVLGYMNQVSGEELARQRGLGYRSGDFVGRAGIERQWEPYLRGKDGFERMVVDAKGHVKSDLEPREIESLVGGAARREPEPGDNLVLTIDVELQRAMQRALARHRSAAAILVDVHSGRVLALASHPDFDPNVMTGRLTRAEAERLQTDPFRPMVNKAVQENYFPASTFKIIPAIAALEDKLVNESEKVLCHAAYRMPGHTYRCMKTHGPMNLHQAIVQSCNIYFYHLAERVGLDRLARWAREFGLGAATGIGLPGEASGFMPTLEYYKKHGGFRIGYTLNTAIGQGSTKTTVVQLALAYAAIANGGDLFVPQLVDRVETPSGKLVQSFPPRVRHHIALSQGTLASLRSALCGVVNELKGTAFTARDTTIHGEVCGKSGTAQLRRNRRGQAGGWSTENDHAWFAGYAPAHDPEVAVVVLVEHGGLGGHVAGPTAVQILKAYFAESAKTATPPVAAASSATADGSTTP